MMVVECIINWVGHAVRVEFDDVLVGTTSKVANEPYEGAVVGITRANTGLRKFAHCEEDISSGVVCKV